MGITFLMTLLIIFMFILLVYGLVHQNKIIIISSITGIMIYFIVLQPILTNGGAIREYQLKKEWASIQEESGEVDFVKHLTLFKTTFAHNESLTEQLMYYTYAHSLRDEIIPIILGEPTTNNLEDIALDKTLKERSEFYQNLIEQHEAVQLPEGVIYEETHEKLKTVLTELYNNTVNQQIQYDLELSETTSDNYSNQQQEYVSNITNELDESLSSLSNNQKVLDETMKQLTNHIESVISNKLHH